jgi:DNA-binding winged helix-turn-helix (wHTH) protein
MYGFGDFQFTVASGELRSPDTSLRLEPQPATMLTLLLERPRDVLSRDELSSAVWPHGFVEADLGLNHCVRQLRRALGDSTQEPAYIETLPRRGYRFIATVTKLTETHSSTQPPPWAPTQMPTPVAEGGATRLRGPRARLLAGVLALAVIALVTFRAVTGPDPAIAVLPFLPLEEDAVASRTGLSFQAHVTEALTELTRGDARIIGPASNVPVANGSALDGAAHMGRRNIAAFLLEKGARLDIFCAAMLGMRSVVEGVLGELLDAINWHGPHGISLIRHAQAGGAGNDALVTYLESLAEARPATTTWAATAAF